LDINNNRQATCKQIFENVVPNIKQFNITDKELVRLFLGKNFNPAYIAYRDSNETIPMMHGKFCSNTSNQWILFTVLQEGIINHFF
jgi:hypothetical protein